MVRSEYERRLSARRAEVEGLERRSGRLASLRLVSFAAAAGCAGVGLVARTFSPWWALAPAAVFLVLVGWHDRVLRRQERARRAAAFWERGLSRLDGTWTGGGVPGERWASAAHPYARDLDLFGSGSLFELLCTARTLPGEETLARWLLAPAPAPVVGERQDAARALAGRLDLREDLAVLGVDVRAEVDPARLAAWGRAPERLPAWTAAAAGVLGALSVATAVACARRRPPALRRCGARGVGLPARAARPRAGGGGRRGAAGARARRPRPRARAPGAGAGREPAAGAAPGPYHGG